MTLVQISTMYAQNNSCWGTELPLKTLADSPKKKKQKHSSRQVSKWSSAWILTTIFRFLSWQERVSKCTLVCKDFCRVVWQTKEEGLVSLEDLRDIPLQKQGYIEKFANTVLHFSIYDESRPFMNAQLQFRLFSSLKGLLSLDLMVAGACEANGFMAQIVDENALRILLQNNYKTLLHLILLLEDMDEHALTIHRLVYGMVFPNVYILECGWWYDFTHVDDWCFHLLLMFPKLQKLNWYMTNPNQLSSYDRNGTKTNFIKDFIKSISEKRSLQTAYVRWDASPKNASIEKPILERHLQKVATYYKNLKETYELS